jgi:flagellar biosynthesis anti-sigma factor FlgM
MKVQGPVKPRLPPLSDQARVKGPERKEEAKATSGERVDVSKLSKLLAEARGPSEPDAGRVQRLKDAIQAGEFTIDADRIASAMVHEEV